MRRKSKLWVVLRSRPASRTCKRLLEVIVRIDFIDRSLDAKVFSDVVVAICVRLLVLAAFVVVGFVVSGGVCYDFTSLASGFGQLLGSFCLQPSAL